MKILPTIGEDRAEWIKKKENTHEGK